MRNRRLRPVGKRDLGGEDGEIPASPTAAAVIFNTFNTRARFTHRYVHHVSGAQSGAVFAVFLSKVNIDNKRDEKRSGAPPSLQSRKISVNTTKEPKKKNVQ